MSTKRSRPASKNTKFDVGRSTFDVREAQLFSRQTCASRTRRWRNAFRRVWPLTAAPRSRIADFFKNLVAQPRKSRRRNPVLAFHHSAAMEPLEPRQLLATMAWSAANDGDLWSNAASWTVTSGTDTDGVPDADDIAVFDASSVKNSTIDANFGVQRLQVGAGYTGTISLGVNTLSTAAEFTVAGASSFDAGTGLVRFAGSQSVNSAAALYNLELPTSNATVTLTQDVNVNNDLTISAVQNINGPGAMKVSGDVTSNVTNLGNTAFVSLVGSADQTLTGLLKHLNIAKTGGDAVLTSDFTVLSTLTGSGLIRNDGGRLLFGSGTINFSGTIDDLELPTSNATVTLTQDVNVNNDLTISAVQNINGPGAMKVSGDVTSNVANLGNTAFVSLVGSADQTLTGLLKHLNIAKTGGDAVLTSDFTVLSTLTGSGLIRNDGGRLLFGSGTINFSGTIDDLELPTSNATVTLTQDVNVNNDLTISAVQNINGPGAMKVSGDVTSNVANLGNTAFVSLVGSADQTLTGLLKHLNIAKTGGDAVLTSDFTVLSTLTGSGLIRNDGGRLLFRSGTINFSGTIDDLELPTSNATVTLTQDVNVNNDLTISAVQNINGPGAMKVSGDVTSNVTNLGNTAFVSLVGSADQTLTGLLKHLNIAKTGGDAVLTSDFTVLSTLTGSGLIRNDGGRLLFRSGTINFSGTIDDLELPTSNATVTLTQDVNVNNDLTISAVQNINGPGAMKVSGDVTSNVTNLGNTAFVSLVGSADQTLTGLLKHLNIAKTGGDAVLTSDFTVLSTLTGSGLIRNDGGRLLFRSGTINFSGTIDDLELPTSNATVTLTQDVNVNNDLTISAAQNINGPGAMKVSGDVASTATALAGSAFVSLVGGSNQNISGVGVLRNLDIAKTSGDVLMSTFNLNFREVTVTAGQWDVLGNTVSATSGFLAQGGKITGTGTLNNNVTVGSGGTLGGTVTVNGSVTANSGGTVAPGESPGIISGGNLTLASGSNFDIEVNGTGTAGVDFDQYVVTGSVSLGGATLNTSGTVMAPGTIVIIDNDGADNVSGTFAGLPNGATVTINGVDFAIQYNDGNNDVVLVPANTPPSIAPQSFNADENQTAVGTVVATDDDLPGDTQTFTTTTGAVGLDNAKFSITTAGLLSFNAAPDFENPTDVGGTPGDNVYLVEVQIEDSAGATDTAIMSVTVDNVQYDVSITANDPDAAEPADDGQYTVSLPAGVVAPVGGLVVNYTVTGTADNGTDYATLSGTVTISAGQNSATIDVDVTDENLVELDETVIVTLDSTSDADFDVAAAPNDSATVTIADDDSATISIAANDPNAAEPNDDGQFTVSMINPSDADTVISYSVSGSADANDDYTALSGSVTIPANATSATIVVEVLDDLLLEGDETLTVTLTGITSSNPGITIGAQDSDTVTIVDDEAVSVEFVSATSSLTEATTGHNVQVQLVGAAGVTLAVPVEASVVDDLTGSVASGNDYAAFGTQVASFGPGSTVGDTRNVTVNVLGDNVVELDEDVDLSIDAVSGPGAAIGAQSTHEVTIENDDSATITIVDASELEGDPGDNNQLVFNVTLDNDVDVPISVDYNVVDGTATVADGDYSGTLNDTLTFSGAAGETLQIVVDVTADNKVELDETLQVILDSLDADGRDVTFTEAYSSTVLNDGPIGYWRLGEAAGATSLLDSSGNGRHLTVSGIESGDFGQAGALPSDPDTAIRFNDAADHASRGNTTDFAFASGQSFSVEFWVKIPVSPAMIKQAGVLTKGYDSTQVQPLYLFMVNPEGEIIFVLRSGGVEQLAKSLPRNDNNWHQVVGVYDATNNEMRLYVDSVLEATKTGVVQAAYGTGSRPFTLGNHLNRITDWSLDEVAIYDRALTHTEIANHSNSVKATGTIENDDSATVSITGESKDEGTGGSTTYTFDIDLSQPVDVAVSMTADTANATATAADDFTAITGGTVSFAAGTTTTQQVNVTVDADNKVELDEAFDLVLSALSAGGRDVTFVGAGATESATAEVNNDDSATISIADATILEGDSGDNQQLVFNVTLDNPVDVDLLIDYGTQDGTAEDENGDADYESQSGTLTINANSLTGQIVVNVTEDDKVEPDETMEVLLTSLDASGRDVSIVAGGGTVSFAEFDPFSGTNVTQVATGSLNGVPFTMTFNDGGVGTWGVRGAYSTFDNTDSTFNTSDFTPSTGNLDLLSAVYSNGGVDGTLIITFDSPIQDPTFHYNGLDRAAWDFGATPGFTSLTKLSGTSDLQIIGSLVRDNNGQNDPGVFASVQLNGTFTTVVVDLIEVGCCGDGYGLQISGIAGTPLTATGTIENDDATPVANDDTNQIDELFGQVDSTSNNITGNVLLDVDHLDGFADVADTDADMPVGGLMVTDVDGNAVTGATNIAGTWGTLTINPDGSYTYDLNDANPALETLDDGSDVTDSFTYTATDGTNVSNSATLTITIHGTTDNTPPEIDPQSFSLDENTDNLTSVGFVAADDPDLPADTLTWTITAGNTGGAFSLVSSTGELKVANKAALDFETTPVFYLTIEVEDQYGETDDAIITVNLNDLEATLSIADKSGLENAGPLVFDVVLTGDDINNAFDVTYSTTDGTAQDAGAGVGSNDYDGTASSTIGFDGNATSETEQITITINGDSVVEDNETFHVNLLSTTSNDISFTDDTAEGTIDNDDSATLTISAPTITETDSDFNVNFTVTLDAAVEGGFDVAHALSLGSAEGSDVTLVTASPIHFDGDANETQDITVTIEGDDIVEDNETFTITLGDVTATTAEQDGDITTGDSAEGTINNDDSATLTIAAPSITETDSDFNVNFTVTLDAEVEGGFDVAHALSLGSAEGSDVTLVTASPIHFDGDANETQDITVTIEGDDIVEDNETFTITLGDVTATTAEQDGDIATGDSAEGTINNDDSATLTITETDSDFNVNFTVTLDAEVEGGFDVAHALSLGSAEASDVTVVTASPIHFDGDANETQDITVTIEGDDIVEDNETFTITLGDVTGTTAEQDGDIATGDSAEGTINNDDSATLTITAPAITETDADQTTLVFTVEVDAAVEGGFKVAFSDLLSGTATVVDDYTVDTASPLTFDGTAGEQETIALTIKGETIVEDNETFTLKLGDVTMTSSEQDDNITTGAQATATINNDDSATLSITAPTITETNADQTTLVFTVEVDAAVEGGFKVAFSDLLSGTATVVDDYTVDTLSPLTFDGTAGEQETIALTIKGETIVEGNETFTLKLGDVTMTSSEQDDNITTGAQATATIDNDDSATLSITAPTITETNADQTTLVFTVEVDAAVEGGFKVAFSDLLSGTATVVDDYTVDTASPLTFDGTAGEQETIALTITGETIVEDNETFTLKLGDVTMTSSEQDDNITTGAQATATIDNDDSATLTITAPSITETDSDFNVNFTVTLNAEVEGGFDVAHALSLGTAEGSDVTVVTASPIHFDGDANETQDITVTIEGDDIVEDNETFTITLGDVTATTAEQDGDIATGDSAEGTINNDDQATLIIDDVSVVEGDVGTVNAVFTVTLDSEVERDVMVDFATADNSAQDENGDNDYSFNNGMLSFAAGSMPGATQSITVQVNGDYLVEPDETYSVNLSNIQAGGLDVIFGDSQGLGTIENDDFLGGRVFDDLDNDGVFEPGDGDAGIGGVLMQLIDEGSGTAVDTDTTDTSGRYEFDVTLPAGTYKIVEAAAAGLLDGKETAGVNGGAVDNSQDSNEITGIDVSGNGSADEQAVDYLFAEIGGSDVYGTVWEDFNNDGEINFGETGINGVSLTLSGTDDRGKPVSVPTTTSGDGSYAFIDLRPGTYSIDETQPAGYDDGQESLGEVTDQGVPTAQGDSGYIDGNDRFAGIQLVPKSEGDLYNFGERPQAGGEIGDSTTATIGFWHNKNGQALIKSLNGSASSTQLGDWLAQTFPNMYGPGAIYDAARGDDQDMDLTGKTNAEVADIFKYLHKRNKKTSVAGGPVKVDAQVMAVALAVYATSENLSGGDYAASYGFNTSTDGIAYTTFNVLDVMTQQEADDMGLTPVMDASGNVTIIDILLTTNDKADEGLLYDADGSGSISNFETMLRRLANELYTAINEGSDI